LALCIGDWSGGLLYDFALLLNIQVLHLSDNMKYLFVIAFLVTFSITVEAQCSMCSAVVESSQQAGSEFAEGLNAGILYLMAIPYTLLMVLGVLLYRKLNQNKAESE